MIIHEIITQLETVPALMGKVYLGVPAQMESLSQAPYVWVTSINEAGGTSPILGPVRQRIEYRFELTVGARNADDMETIRNAVKGAMLNFQPIPESDPIIFRAGRMEFGDPGWFLWRDEFRTSYFEDTR